MTLHIEGLFIWFGPRLQKSQDRPCKSVMGFADEQAWLNLVEVN
jgi:hypothetical protein